MSDSEIGENAEPEAAHPTRPLTKWERFAAGAFGFLVMGAGCAAVFTRKVEAGPTALIVIGAVLMIMSITGAPITRARFGDSEVTLAARRLEATRVIAEAEPENAAPALAVMAAYDPGAQVPLVQPRPIHELVREFDQRLEIALKARYGARLEANVFSQDTRLDYVVRRENGPVPIDYYFSTTDFSNKNRRALATHVQYILDSEFSGGVVVANVSLPDTLIDKEVQRASRFGKMVRIVSVDTDLREPSNLFEAIDTLPDA